MEGYIVASCSNFTSVLIATPSPIYTLWWRSSLSYTLSSLALSPPLRPLFPSTYTLYIHTSACLPFSCLYSCPCQALSVPLPLLSACIPNPCRTVPFPVIPPPPPHTKNYSTLLATYFTSAIPTHLIGSGTRKCSQCPPNPQQLSP